MRMRESIRRSWGAFLVVALLATPALAARGPRPQAPAPGQRTSLPGVVLVKLRQSAGAAKAAPAVQAVLAREGLHKLEPVAPWLRAAAKPGGPDLSRVFAAEYTSGADPEVVAARLAALPEVEYAEPQWVYRIAVDPNDPSWPNQSTYMSTRPHFPLAWDVARGEQGNVVVAIIDGGTDWRHVDLQANVWTNPGEIAANGVDDDLNGFIDDVHGWNFANGTNDPTGLPTTPDNAEHGTHTAGIVCAVTNNGAGIAGGSWNAKLMPVCTSSTNDRSIAYGYQGILYAAQNGADIINCSWGGQGSPSSFEIEVIETARSLGAAIVAAAGNNNTQAPHYPSAYPQVLSVGNVTRFDVRVSGSNYGTTLDVSAPGEGILSTFPGGVYGSLTGTSMSSPLAAAVAALVKTRWPGYTPDQVLQRVRVTSDNIDAANPSRRGLLGYGRINAEQALKKNTPALRITQLQVADSDGDGVIEPDETVTLTISVTNYLALCTDVAFKLRETSLQASVLDSLAVVGEIDSMQTVQLPPLSLQVAATAPIQHVIGCLLQMDTSAPLYTDKDRFDLTVQPVFATHDANNVLTSVTSVGKLGFGQVAGGNGADGVGFHYKGGPNLLFEGALMLGTNSAHISDAARRSETVTDQDFATVPGGVPTRSAPGTIADQQTVAVLNDSLAPVAGRLNVRLRQDSYQFTAAPDADYLILRYTIFNAGANALNGLRVGWFCDWDLDGSSYITNRTSYDATRGLGYVWDDGPGPDTYVGMRVLTAPGTTTYRGIWNAEDAPGNPSWGVYLDYTDTEKWDSLAGGIQFTDAGPEDISNAIATGPFDVPPGGAIVVAFAVVGGDDLPSLQSAADAALAKWQAIEDDTPVELYDFAAVQDEADVVLRWRTQAETDVEAFRVFRARTGEPFAALGPDLLPNTERAYSFRDPAPGEGRWVYRVGEVNAAGDVVLHGSVEIEVAPAVPRRTGLDPAVPNPFNPTTTLRFGVAQPGPVQLLIHDVRGRIVRTLVRAAHLEPGWRQVTWDGRDDRGRRVASGVYHARLEAAGLSFTRRLTLVK
jgi:hypothetical protein